MTDFMKFLKDYGFSYLSVRTSMVQTPPIFATYNLKDSKVIK